MKRVLSVVLTVFFCLSLVACDQEGSFFKYDIESEPVSLDPQSADDPNALLVIQNIFEGLLTIGEDGKLREGVAQNWSMSEDGLSYTFELRPDAKWSDGTPVTAADFVFAFRRLFTAETKAPRASEFFCIKNAQAALEGKKNVQEIGVTADGEQRVVFQLEYPNALFLQLLTTAPAMPCNEAFFYSTKGKYGLEATRTIDKKKTYMTLCNGPFYLSTWSHNSHLILRQNEHYKGVSEVLAEGVTFSIYKKSEEEPSFEEYKIKRFQAQETDAVIVSGDQLRSMGEEAQQGIGYQNTTVGLLFNQRDAELSNSNIRRALFSLLDTAVYKDLLREDDYIAGGIVPPGITLLDVSFREYAGESILPAYDAARAREYYQKGLAELQKDQLEKVTLIVTDPEQEKLFGYLSQVWQRELGLFAKVESVSVADMEKRLKNGNFGIAFYTLSGVYNSPNSILGSFVTGRGNNYAGYSNKDYDAYMSKGLKAFDMAKSAENFRSAERLLVSDGVFLPLYYQQKYFTVGAGTSGIQYFPQGDLISFACGEKKN